MAALGGKMAAPSSGLCGFRRSAMAARVWWAAGCGRRLSTAPPAAAPRPWKLFGALCLLRLPRITQPLRKEEEEMAALMEQVAGRCPGENGCPGAGKSSGSTSSLAFSFGPLTAIKHHFWRCSGTAEMWH